MQDLKPAGGFKMVKGMELLNIIVIALILSLSITLLTSVESFIYVFISMAAIMFITILIKEITAYYLDSEIETKLWEIQQYGFSPSKRFKKKFPAGIFLPIIVSAFTFGTLYWMASLVFEVRPKIYRAAKRHGLYSFSEMTEWHVGIIAAMGIFMSLILAVTGYLIGLEEFAKLSIFYAFFNMIPISNLDGNKVFFGNFVMWSFLAILTLIGLGYVFFIV